MDETVADEVGSIFISARHDVWLDEEVLEEDGQGNEFESRIARHVAMVFDLATIWKKISRVVEVAGGRLLLHQSPTSNFNLFALRRHRKHSRGDLEINSHRVTAACFRGLLPDFVSLHVAVQRWCLAAA